MNEHHHGKIDPHHHMKDGHKDMPKYSKDECHLEVHHMEHEKYPHGQTVHAMGAQEGGIGMTEMSHSNPHHEVHIHEFKHPSTAHMHEKGELPKHAKGMSY